MNSRPCYLAESVRGMSTYKSRSMSITAKVEKSRGWMTDGNCAQRNGALRRDDIRPSTPVISSSSHLKRRINRLAHRRWHRVGSKIFNSGSMRSITLGGWRRITILNVAWEMNRSNVTPHSKTRMHSSSRMLGSLPRSALFMPAPMRPTTFLSSRHRSWWQVKFNTFTLPFIQFGFESLIPQTLSLFIRKGHVFSNGHPARQHLVGVNFHTLQEFGKARVTPENFLTTLCYASFTMSLQISANKPLHNRTHCYTVALADLLKTPFQVSVNGDGQSCAHMCSPPHNGFTGIALRNQGNAQCIILQGGHD